jgi:hypothetical protein
MSWRDDDRGGDVRGFYRDVVAPGGAAAADRGWRKNLIVDGCRVLLAGAVLGAGPTGIQALAVGRGLAAWDTTAPPPAPPAQAALVDPAPVLLPISAADMTFVDADGNPSAEPTRRIQIRVVLAPGTPAIPGGETAYPLREFGLLGRLGAASFLVNYVRHGVIHKAAGDSLTRTVRLVF